MVRIDYEGKGAKIAHQGDPVDVAIELAACVGQIYNAFKTESIRGAEEFRKAICTLIRGADSPIWTKAENLTVITIPDMKKGGAPTDQS